MKKIIGGLFGVAFAAAAAAQSAFPSKPITIVVGFEPGGGTDTTARILQKPLGEQVGQQVIVENRGRAGHVAGELLRTMSHADLIHVPYKGGGPAMQGFLGGQVDSFFATPISSVSQIRAGKAIAVATTGSKRAALMPDVPTVAESGYPRYEALNWYGFLGP